MLFRHFSYNNVGPKPHITQNCYKLPKSSLNSAVWGARSPVIFILCAPLGPYWPFLSFKLAKYLALLLWNPAASRKLRTCSNRPPTLTCGSSWATCCSSLFLLHQQSEVICLMTSVHKLNSRQPIFHLVQVLRESGILGLKNENPCFENFSGVSGSWFHLKGGEESQGFLEVKHLESQNGFLAMSTPNPNISRTIFSFTNGWVEIKIFHFWDIGLEVERSQLVFRKISK